MRMLGLMLVALVAAIHAYIAWFEIFAWESRGPNVFKNFPPELFPQTVDMAANQGLYNGFLAVGLIWSLFIKDRAWQRNVVSCFLLFVAVAGVFGALTVATMTLVVQTVPALIALIVIQVSARRSDGV